MRKIHGMLFLLLLITSCISVRKDNEQKSVCIPPEKLKQDVDFAHSKLRELHPQLYWYISENELNRKFDSLKKTLDAPLTPLEFYFKLQPVIADVREAHLSLRIPMKKLTRREEKSMENKKAMFSRFEYYVEGSHLYIARNKDSVENIRPGTEILAINNIPASAYLKRYGRLVNSDGFNTTFQPYFLKDWLFYFYVAENGYQDRAKLETLYEGKIKNVYLKRETKSTDEIQKEKELSKRTQERKINDYVAFNDSYNRNFSFLDADSTIAYIKVKSFSQTFASAFYREAFRKIKAAEAPYLIIDIRNNYGGSLEEINTLYTYLSTEPFTLIKPSQVASGTAPLKTRYFRKSTPLEYAAKIFTYPAFFFGQIFSTYKKNGIAYYRIRADKTSAPAKDAFTGKVFVLMNGGSFSASSILAAKLKYDKKAVLVGEETGGANDGTVAGFYSYQQLPHSRIDLPIGLVWVQPDIAFTHTRKGVLPDIPVKETLADIIRKKDPQLERVLDEIKKESTIKKQQGTDDQ